MTGRSPSGARRPLDFSASAQVHAGERERLKRWRDADARTHTHTQTLTSKQRAERNVHALRSKNKSSAGVPVRRVPPGESAGSLAVVLRVVFSLLEEAAAYRSKLCCSACYVTAMLNDWHPRRGDWPTAKAHVKSSKREQQKKEKFTKERARRKIPRRGK